MSPAGLQLVVERDPLITGNLFNPPFRFVG
jgi:hypothetical protein